MTGTFPEKILCAHMHAYVYKSLHPRKVERDPIADQMIMPRSNVVNEFTLLASRSLDEGLLTEAKMANK